MSRRPERIVYSASSRDFVFTIFPGGRFSTATPVFNISNDLGRVKELLLLDLAVLRTPFPSAHTHWFSRERNDLASNDLFPTAWLGPVFFIIVVA
jgi:hypothetical protein